MKLAAAGAAGAAAAGAWYCGRATVACSPPYWPPLLYWLPLPYWPPLYWLPLLYWPPLYWLPLPYWLPLYCSDRDWSPSAAADPAEREPGCACPAASAAGAAPSAATFAYFSRKSMMLVASTQDARSAMNRRMCGCRSWLSNAARSR